MSYGAITGQKPETPDIPQPGLKWELVKSGPVDWEMNQYGYIKSGQYIVNHTLSAEKNDILYIVVKLKGQFVIERKDGESGSGFIYSRDGTQLLNWSFFSAEQQKYDVNLVSTAKFLYRNKDDVYFEFNGGKQINDNPNDVQVFLEFRGNSEHYMPNLVSSNLHYDIYVGKISI